MSRMRKYQSAASIFLAWAKVSGESRDETSIQTRVISTLTWFRKASGLSAGLRAVCRGVDENREEGSRDSMTADVSKIKEEPL